MALSLFGAGKKFEQDLENLIDAAEQQLRENRLQDARTSCYQVLKLEPDSLRGHWTMARILEGISGCEREAAKHYQEFISLAPAAVWSTSKSENMGAESEDGRSRNLFSGVNRAIEKVKRGMKYNRGAGAIEAEESEKLPREKADGRHGSVGNVSSRSIENREGNKGEKNTRPSTRGSNRTNDQMSDGTDSEDEPHLFGMGTASELIGRAHHRLGWLMFYFLDKPERGLVHLEEAKKIFQKHPWLDDDIARAKEKVRRKEAVEKLEKSHSSASQKVVKARKGACSILQSTRLPRTSVLPRVSPKKTNAQSFFSRISALSAGSGSESGSEFDKSSNNLRYEDSGATKTPLSVDNRRQSFRQPFHARRASRKYSMDKTSLEEAIKRGLINSSTIGILFNDADGTVTPSRDGSRPNTSHSVRNLNEFPPIDESNLLTKQASMLVPNRSTLNIESKDNLASGEASVKLKTVKTRAELRAKNRERMKQRLGSHATFSREPSRASGLISSRTSITTHSFTDQESPENFGDQSGKSDSVQLTDKQVSKPKSREDIKAKNMRSKRVSFAYIEEEDEQDIDSDSDGTKSPLTNINRSSTPPRRISSRPTSKTAPRNLTVEQVLEKVKSADIVRVERAADACLKGADWQLAELLFVEVLRRDTIPRPSALYGIGVASWKQNRRRDALTFFQNALTAESTFVKARHDMGMLLLEMGRVSDARDELIKTTEDCARQPGTRQVASSCLLMLSDVYERENKLDKALESAERACQLDPDNVVMINTKNILAEEVRKRKEEEANMEYQNWLREAAKGFQALTADQDMVDRSTVKTSENKGYRTTHSLLHDEMYSTSRQGSPNQWSSTRKTYTTNTTSSRAHTAEEMGTLRSSASQEVESDALKLKRKVEATNAAYSRLKDQWIAEGKYLSELL